MTHADQSIEVGSVTISDKLEACIRALGQTDPKYDRDTLLDCGHQMPEGTCQRILENGVFQKWKSEEDSEQPLIWVCEQPGMGKTTMAIFISQYLEQSEHTKDDYWVLYYFCDAQNVDRNTAACILKGFILQLYQKRPRLGAILYDDYRIQGDALLQPSSIAALWGIFEKMVSESPVKRIFCIIDGVDQCQEKTLDHFLKKLKKYFMVHNQKSDLKKADTTQNGSSDATLPTNAQPRRGPELRMIILSDEDPSCIVRELNPFPRLLVGDDGAQTRASDLKRVVEANAEKISARCSGNKKPNKETTEIISQALGDGEDRSFLWVSLVTEKLMTMKHSQIKKYLAQIPKTVEGLYIQELVEIPPHQRPQVAAILKWVTLAVKPLSILELTKAVKYSLNSSFSKKNLQKALGMCKGLVQKRKKKVILAHQLVETFLFGKWSPLRQNKGLNDFVFDKSNAHSELANTCIAYLQGSANLEKSRKVRLKPGDELNTEDAAFFSKHPFLEYAIANWTFHAKQGNIETTNYDVPFFKDDSVRRRRWWKSHWISQRHLFAWKWTTPGNFSLLHLAAFFDIVPLALYVERRGRIQEFLGAEDHLGKKPINWATERSQAAMVRFLLEKGEFDNEALRQAAQTGDVSIIKMLLENRDRLLHSPKMGSPKSSPATSPGPFQSLRKVTLGSLADLSKKLDQTKDVNSTPLSPDVEGYGKITSETPLHIAATCGHDDAIEVFLNAGEDFFKATDGGWTALHNAAWFGRVSIVNRLIAAGADARAETKEKLTPLHCAVKNAQPEVVKCLLSKREGQGIVDIEAKDQFGLTPFHVACKSHNLLIAEILLDQGASIERQMRQGWTPLIWACMDGDFKLTKLLLNRGADINAKWVHIYTDTGSTIELGPVGVAKAYKNESIAQLVEKSGAIDANRVSGDEAKSLPSATAAEEKYSLPEVQDIVALERVDTETDGALDVGDSGSSVGSDGDSDDGSEVSGEASRSRKQSASGIQGEVKHRKRSSLAGLGLVMHEEVSGVEKANAEQDDKSEEREASVDTTGYNVGSTSQDAPVFATQVTSQSEGVFTSLDPSEGISRTLSPVAVGEGVSENSADDASMDPRSGSVSKSPGSFGDRFSRFIPKRAINRTGSNPISGEAVSTEMTEEPSMIAAESGDVVSGEAISPAADPTKPNAGILGRFGAKRGFSWKKEGSGESGKITSPKP